LLGGEADCFTTIVNSIKYIINSLRHLIGIAKNAVNHGEIAPNLPRIRIEADVNDTNVANIT